MITRQLINDGNCGILKLDLGSPKFATLLLPKDFLWIGLLRNLYLTMD